jgi:hypothetical protein
MDTNPVAEVTTAPSEGGSPEDRLMALYSEEPEEQSDEPEAEDAPDTESDTPAESEAPEVVNDQADEAFEEVEYDGKPVKLPPKIAEVVKKAESLQADYTRKTQEVAEQRRAVEDKQHYIAAKELILQSAFKEAAEVESIQSQLSQFDALDWNSLVIEDAQKALQLNFARQQLQSKLAAKQGELQKTIEKAQAAKAQHDRQQMELGKAELARRVGKISDADRAATWQQALTLGFSEHELASATDPRLMHALFKAAKFDAMQAATQTALTKKVPQAKPMTTPAARASTTQAESSREALEKRLRKTGKQEDAIAVLMSRLEMKRKR